MSSRKNTSYKYCYNSNYWCSNNKNYQSLKEKYDIKPDQLVVGGSGSISSRKGTDIFYEVSKIIKKII